jgi:(p)ppGpp synthase/HD superfamily hydrolase
MMMQFSSRFDQALIVAALAHRSQVRKDTCIPYVMHPFHVAVLLERHGFPEPVVVAGLLHDVLEDTDFDSAAVRESFAATFPAFRELGGTAEPFRGAMIAFIRSQFGEDVLAMVEAVTEKKEAAGRKRPWRTRKDEQFAHVAAMSLNAAAVKAADTVHNARSILRDLQSRGSAVFHRFNCSPLELLWYYGTLDGTIRKRLGDRHPLALELEEAVRDLNEGARSLLEPARPLVSRNHGS